MGRLHRSRSGGGLLGWGLLRVSRENAACWILARSVNLPSLACGAEVSINGDIRIFSEHCSALVDMLELDLGAGLRRLARGGSSQASVLRAAIAACRSASDRDADAASSEARSADEALPDRRALPPISLCLRHRPPSCLSRRCEVRPYRPRVCARIALPHSCTLATSRDARAPRGQSIKVDDIDNDLVTPRNSVAMR